MILQLIAAENLIRVISDQDKYCVWVVPMFHSAVNTSHAYKRQSCCEAYNQMKEIKILQCYAFSHLFITYHLWNRGNKWGLK